MDREGKTKTYDEKMRMYKRKIRFWSRIAIGGAVLTMVGHGASLYKESLNRQAEKEPDASQGAYEEFTPVKGPVKIVYEGQKEPKCVGDIEKVVPQLNEQGKLTRLNVICKPAAAEPAK